MNFKTSLLRTTLLATFAGASSIGGVEAAQAQEAQKTADVVVITGSRIARQDYVSDSPIVTVDADAIAATGTTTLDSLINEMPQFTPAVTPTSNNPGGSGQANIQLRGLGTNRTLILMDGRRLIPSNSDGTVDLNILPAQLVGNIETITGGASATYGSDAMAGVVNFKLRNDFQGLEVSTNYGETSRNDGASESVSLASGGKFADGKGHAMVMLTWNHRDAIYNSARPASAISGASGSSPLGSTVFDGTNLPTAASLQTATGSAAVKPGDTYGFNNGGTLFDYVNRVNFQSPGGITYDGFIQPGATFNPNFQFNTGALNYLQLPQDRYNAYASGDYKINNNFDVYSSLLFTSYSSASELAASPAAQPATGFRVPVTNPYISASLAGVLATRPIPGATFILNKRFTALGARHQESDYSVYMFTTGVKGDLGFGDWTYDLYGETGEVQRTTIQTGNVSRSKVQSLLNATDGGASLCAGGFNPFGDNAISSACASYIGITSKNFQVQDQRNVEFNAQGSLFKLPAGDVRLAVGSDYREDRLKFLPDGSLTGGITVQPCLGGTSPSGVCTGGFATSSTGAVGNPALTGNDVAGFNPSGALAGYISVREFYTEALIPVLKDLPFAKEVNLTIGGRTSDYSTVGNVGTYKVNLDWQLIDSVRLRGSYERATRAPSIGELYSPVLLGFPAIGAPQTATLAPQKSGDPCDVRSGYRSTSGTNLAASTNAAVRALCLTQGVNAAVIDSYTYTNAQVSGLSGGNPNLKEETSDTRSYGIVWQPHFAMPILSKISASVDYFDIKLQNAVGTIDANTMVSRCFNVNGTSNPTYDPNNAFCKLFVRDPLSGNITNAASNNTNIGTAETSGIDFQADWAYDVGPGTLSVSTIGAWLEQFKQELVPGNVQKLKGFISNVGSLGSSVGAAFPEWKLLTTVNYAWGPVKAGLRWQHINGMDNINSPGTKIPAIGYLDLLASWNINDNLALHATVNNIMDQLPPIYTPAVQGNTDPSTYDVLGRRFTVGLTARF